MAEHGNREPIQSREFLTKENAMTNERRVERGDVVDVYGTTGRVIGRAWVSASDDSGWVGCTDGVHYSHAHHTPVEFVAYPEPGSVWRGVDNDHAVVIDHVDRFHGAVSSSACDGSFERSSMSVVGFLTHYKLDDDAPQTDCHECHDVSEFSRNVCVMCGDDIAVDDAIGTVLCCDDCGNQIRPTTEYFTLLMRGDGATWGVEFGDFDHDVVEETLDYYRDIEEVPASCLKIITTFAVDDHAITVDAAVRELNRKDLANRTPRKRKGGAA